MINMMEECLCFERYLRSDYTDIHSFEDTKKNTRYRFELIADKKQNTHTNISDEC